MKFVSVAVLLLVVPAYCHDRVYRTGTLTEVVIEDLTAPMKVPPLTLGGSALNLTLPLGVVYQFNIEASDVTYVGGCFSKAKKSYAADWVIHDPVQFRIDKDKLFLKRPHGKELRLGLITRVRATQPAPAPPDKSANQMIPNCR